MKFVINHLHIVDSKDNISVNLKIENGKISKVSSNTIEIDNEMLFLNMDQALVFPAIVNSHDHLDFNLFPEIGSPKKYQDYLEWARNIQSNHQTEIQKILKIPLDKRIKYGLYKNFFSGITHVINHDHYYPAYKNELVNVFNSCYNLHSVGFEKFWKAKLNFRKPYLPAVIHIGEGTGHYASREIDTLIKWNCFNRKIIGVHGIAMNTNQAKHFEALVWCPDSNLRLYNQTADIETLKKAVPILFGTDSTLSAHWNFWQQLRKARELQKLNDLELYHSLTKTAKKIWGLQTADKVEESQSADIVVAKKKKKNKWDAFYAIDPEDILLIIKNGDLNYFDNSLLPQIKESMLASFDKVKFNNHIKYVKFDDATRPLDKTITF